MGSVAGLCDGCIPSTGVASPAPPGTEPGDRASTHVPHGCYLRRPMRRFIVSVIALAPTLVAAPPVAAATLSTGTRCYRETQDVVLRGAGYAPAGRIAISRDGAPFGSAVADAAGAFEVKFQADELRPGVREKLFTLTAADAALNTVTTRYRTSKVFAGFTPDEGDPQTLKVRFSVSGFGLLRRRASVYLHYVSPSGKVRRDVRLGTSEGACGVIRRTRLRRLFPFPAERGRWVLQFDTNKKYTRATRTSPYTWVRKPVKIFTR